MKEDLKKNYTYSMEPEARPTFSSSVSSLLQASRTASAMPEELATKLSEPPPLSLDSDEPLAKVWRKREEALASSSSSPPAASSSSGLM